MYAEPYRPPLNPDFVQRVRATRKQEQIMREELARQQKADQDRADALARLSAPSWVVKTILAAADDYGVSPAEILSNCQRKPVLKARNEAIYTVKATKPTLSAPRMGLWFGRNPKSILHSIATHALANGLPKLVGYDVERALERMRGYAS